MRKLALLLLLSGCNLCPPYQVDWRCILYEPTMNCLMDSTSSPSSNVALSFVQFRGFQLRIHLIDSHIADQQKLIADLSDLVERGYASAIDLKQAESFAATLQAEKAQLELALDKALIDLAKLLKTDPFRLCYLFCREGCLPTPLRPIPCLSGCNSILDTALAAYTHDEERTAALQTAVQSAKEAYSMTYDLYKRGFKSTSDLIASHQTLLQVEDNLIQAEVDFLTDFINLYKFKYS